MNKINQTIGIWQKVQMVKNHYNEMYEEKRIVENENEKRFWNTQEMKTLRSFYSKSNRN